MTEYKANWHAFCDEPLHEVLDGEQYKCPAVVKLESSWPQWNAFG